MSYTKSLIQGGKHVDREHFPWTVAVFVKQQFGSFSYFSTGTLISDRHIVSTGLSFAYLDNVSQKYVARSPDDFKMVFGVNNLDETSAQGSFTIEGASKVILHPDIQHGFPRLANIAILELAHGVQFNKWVTPACLPSSDITTDLPGLVGKTAFAVGWGQDDTGHDSKVKNCAIVKFRSESDCENYWGNSLRKSGTRKFFCAGGDGRQSACYRDQPLYVKTNSVWELRGLISIAENLPNGKCDLNKPVLYEDVGQYYHWLQLVSG